MRIWDALFRAILEAPDDDAPRLVAADWLEEHGDPDRAEFIRVQCLRETLDEDDPRQAELQRRERQLLTGRARDCWERPLRRLRSWRWEYRRGFVAATQMEAPKFLAHAEALTVLAPLTELNLQFFDHCFDLLGRLAKCPQLARLRSLGLRGSSAPIVVRLPPQGVCELLKSPHLAGLRHLDLGENHLRNAGARLLAEAPLPAGLESLRLDWNWIGNDGLAALLAAPHLPSLRALDLGCNGLGATGARRLARARPLTGLRRLCLASNRLGDTGAARLAAEPFAELTHLDLSENLLTDAALEALASLRGVRTLWVAGNRLRDAGLRSLARAPGWAGLRHLNAAHNGVSSAGVAALAAGPARLRTLRLSSNRLDATAAALLAGPAFAELEHLDLSSNPLGPDGATVLAAASHPRLETLDLMSTGLADTGVRCLAASPLLAGVGRLNLVNNGLTDASLPALVSSPHLRNVELLRLAFNSFTDAGCDTLRGHFGSRVNFHHFPIPRRLAVDG